MATTKEIINFNSSFEEIDYSAQPANYNRYHSRAITKEAEARIQAFRKKRLGQAALGLLDLDHLAV